ncbi:MAG: hypothetical protein ACXU9A_27190, partial [Xanthobacteraceae bacterium]
CAGLKNNPGPVAEEVEISTVSVQTFASATRVFSGTFQGRTPCLIAYNLTLPLPWSASRTNHRPLPGSASL